VNRWCPTCRQEVLTKSGVCVWCESSTYRRRTGGGGRLTDDQVRTFHRAHAAGQSLNQLAAFAHRRFGYASKGSAMNVLTKGFERLGLPVRSRAEAMRLLNLKVQPVPAGPGRCQGTRINSPGRGNPCLRRAMEGSDFCFSHDPRFAEQRLDHFERVRGRMAA
jgi:hypothetical protein